MSRNSERRTKPGRVFVIYFLLAFCLLGSLSTGYYFFKSSEYIISQKAADDVDIKAAEKCYSESDTRKCFDRLARIAVESGNLGVFFGQFRDGMQRNTEVLTHCHSLLHSLGEEVGKKVDLETALSLPYNDCNFGFYHGVMWTHTADMDFIELQNNSISVCQRFIDRGGIDNYATRDCVHGIGHLLWKKSDKNLESVLNGCLSLGNDMLYEPCAIGATMETSVELISPALTRNDGNFREFIRAFGNSGPDYSIKYYQEVCDNLKNQNLRIGCRSGLIVAAYDVWKQDAKRAAELCDTAPKGVELDQCYTYFGGVALERGGSVEAGGWDVNRMYNICKAHEPATAKCIDMISYSVYRISEKTAIAFCAIVEEKYFKICEGGYARALEYNQELEIASGS
ncbi:MAG: hypothetical protein ACKOW9_03520 [Candidatus Paceibacterota bacterium]